MQRVIHEYRNRSRIFGMIEGLYTYVSDINLENDDILWLDESFKDICDILQSKLLLFRTPVLKSYNFDEIKYPRRISKDLASDCDTKKEIIVCLSGGKDSVAVAYYYKQKGYTVHLYHMHGVNKSYGDEQTAAEKIAEYLGCDLFIDRIQLTGFQSYIEHPLKNYLIANGAVHYAIENGYAPVISFGNFNQSFLDMNEFEVCGGDCVEMWDAYRNIIRTVLPDFDIKLPLATNADTFKLLVNDWDLFNMSVSCMSPYRFREHWKHRTEQKFNVKLLENRCGVCWKCCMEMMWLMDNGYADYNEEYYLHCIGILVKTIYKEMGEMVDDIDLVWGEYMFYPMSESKAYDVLKNCKITGIRSDLAAKIYRKCRSSEDAT